MTTTTTDSSFLAGDSERTLAIIKPEAYEDAEAIENTLKKNAFTILAKRTVKLTPEHAADFYSCHYGKQHFPHLVAHMSSGPIVALVLAAPDAVERLKELMGPARYKSGDSVSPTEAHSKADLYSRHYGKQHFPHLVAHMSSGPIVALVLAAPDAVERLRELMGPASRYNKADLYSRHYGKQHFPHLVAHMSSGPVVALVLAALDAVERLTELMGPANGPIVALVLAAPDAVEKLRELMGPARVEEALAYWPDSLRASYGRRSPYGDYFNGIHGSASHPEAVREIHFFFSNMIVGPILSQWQIKDYIQKHITPTLLPALAQLANERPDEPVLWLAEQLRRANPNEPEITMKGAADDPRCHSSHGSEESIK
ncbi:unnamed protein product [Plutella xylostella]|uniref:(diamondback moth) hypothetical protein n=1 Tax=Plutella xylostella TaxID=51655 RepID=A0A8S4EUS1_PLUXY|nr:unnamed protein product [Plutella xylostella]